MKYRLLSADEIAAALTDLPEWQHEHGRIKRELTFATFAEAFGFMSSVALIAERQDHHPEFWNVYNRVRLTVWTHDAAGITEHDFALARAVEALL